MRVERFINANSFQELLASQFSVSKFEIGEQILHVSNIENVCKTV